ncbi:MAG: GvpL/GvpF family gas vesicle protein [Cyclobacteriaceae bacterium]
MNKYYLYGVISADVDKSFGVLDLAAKDPVIINSSSFNGLSVIHSDIVLDDEEEVIPSRKNMLNHQKAIERVMEEHNILPFSFGMVVDDMDALKEVITNKFEFFNEKLKKIDGQIELSLKGIWNDMTVVYDHILNTNEEIRKYKSKILKSGDPDQNEKIELGKMVEFALTLEKERLSDKVVNQLSEGYKDYRINKNITEAMFCNLAFLVEKDKESAFDTLVNKVGEELDVNITFKYVGPMPPYNFID